MASGILVKIGSGNGLVPDGTKPLPGPILGLSSITSQATHLNAFYIIVKKWKTAITFPRVQCVDVVYEENKDQQFQITLVYIANQDLLSVLERFKQHSKYVPLLGCRCCDEKVRNASWERGRVREGRVQVDHCRGCNCGDVRGSVMKKLWYAHMLVGMHPCGRPNSISMG